LRPRSSWAGDLTAAGFPSRQQRLPNKIKHFRGLATRCEKHAANFLGEHLDRYADTYRTKFGLSRAEIIRYSASMPGVPARHRTGRHAGIDR
jgi:hypothetical protein